MLMSKSTEYPRVSVHLFVFRISRAGNFRFGTKAHMKGERKTSFLRARERGAAIFT